MARPLAEDDIELDEFATARFHLATVAPPSAVSPPNTRPMSLAWPLVVAAIALVSLFVASTSRRLALPAASTVASPASTAPPTTTPPPTTVPATTAPPAPAPAAPAPAAPAAPASPCHDGDPLQAVPNRDRLEVVEPCKSVVGTVRSVRWTGDGSYAVRLAADDEAIGTISVVIIPNLCPPGSGAPPCGAFAAGIPVLEPPPTGARVSMSGAWVRAGNATEIHPLEEWHKVP